MSSVTASVPFDARPLTEPVDGAAVRAHTRQLRENGQAPASVKTTMIVIGSIVGLFMIGVVSSIFLAFMLAAASSPTFFEGFGVLFVIAPAGVLLIVLSLLITVIVRTVRASPGTRWYRLARFAQANGMTFLPVVDAPPLPGMIFGLGSDRKATDVVRGERPRFVEFANYAYTTGSGDNSTTHNWGYVAVRLSSPLPHIVLDAVANDSRFGSSLPASFDRSQRLSLEGDFDRHFSLYCPAGYERDALYLFTPDIMARFVDNAAALDVEIVDDWLFFYTRRQVSTVDPATWAWLFGIVRAVLDKLAQWERWRDERLRTDAGAAASGSAPLAAGAAAGAGDTTDLPFAAPTALLRPPPGVAPQGRRLKRGPVWPSVIVFGAVVLWWLFAQSDIVPALLRGLLP